MRYHVGVFMTLLLLCGCGKSQDHLEQQMHRTEEQIKFSTVKHETAIDQHDSNQAKEIVATFPEATEVFAANTNNRLMVAFDVTHMNRFQLKQIEKSVTKRLKKEFPHMKIEVSTDEKMRLELKKLEEDLHTKNLPRQDVESRIKKIISLSKEET